MIRVFDALRLLLGAVLVLTAFDYFMPFIVPYVEQAQFDDPLAARLVGALDKSGLLAVGKFLQLAAGLLLLVDRTVPFALAAVLPANICGTFIAVFVEGDPLPALAALALVALNGLLMLAYLPYYAGVLRPEQLADWEGPEPGRNYNSLFVNPFAGAPAKAYFAGAIALAAACYAYWDVIPFDNGTTGLVTLIFPGAVFAIGLVLSLVKGRSCSP